MAGSSVFLVPKTDYIELGNGDQIPILYEDRSVIAIDKPPGWMLVPVSWQNTKRNLQAALLSSIEEGRFWARSRNLRYLRYVHRLDAETTGVLLLARSPGALHTLGRMFESRQMEKVYLAVVEGVPKQERWTCQQKIGIDPREHGLMQVDEPNGKEAVTDFLRLETRPLGQNKRVTLVEAHPFTGRTHQIRLHLAASGHPILGEPVYTAGGRAPESALRRRPPARQGAPRPSARPFAPKPASAKPGLAAELALRAVSLQYASPFDGRAVRIEAPRDLFLRHYGFAGSSARTPQGDQPLEPR